MEIGYCEISFAGFGLLIWIGGLDGVEVSIVRRQWTTHLEGSLYVPLAPYSTQHPFNVNSSQKQLKILK